MLRSRKTGPVLVVFCLYDHFSPPQNEFSRISDLWPTAGVEPAGNVSPNFRVCLYTCNVNITLLSVNTHEGLNKHFKNSLQHLSECKGRKFFPKIYQIKIH